MRLQGLTETDGRAGCGPRIPPLSDALRPLHEQIAELEHRAIAQALVHTGGNRTAAARLLGISRASLYARDSYAGANGADAVWTAWHVMNNFDLPRGILRNVTDNGVESTEYTLWTSVADTKNLRYYYRVYENPAIYELDLNVQDPSGTAVLVDSRPSEAPPATVPVAFPAEG